MAANSGGVADKGCGGQQPGGHFLSDVFSENTFTCFLCPRCTIKPDQLLFSAKANIIPNWMFNVQWEDLMMLRFSNTNSSMLFKILSVGKAPRVEFGIVIR